MFFTRISCENPKMEKIPENHPWVFQKWTIFSMSKKNFSKIIFRDFFQRNKIL